MDASEEPDCNNHVFSLHCVFLCVSAQDLLQRVQKHSEVEMVDLVLKLKDKLVGAHSKAEIVPLEYLNFIHECNNNR